MAKNLIEYLPESYQTIYEVTSLFSALQDELDYIKDLAEQYKENLFISTCDDDMTKRYCDFLDISSSDDMKTTLIIKISKIPPYDVSALEEYLKMYVTKCEIVLNDDLTIDIFYRTGGREINPNLVINDLYKLIPANLSVNFEYFYALYSDIYGKTWRELSEYTWAEIIY